MAMQTEPLMKEILQSFGECCRKRRWALLCAGCANMNRTVVGSLGLCFSECTNQIEFWKSETWDLVHPVLLDIRNSGPLAVFGLSANWNTIPPGHISLKTERPALGTKTKKRTTKEFPNAGLLLR